jgi:hypothetical protein
VKCFHHPSDDAVGLCKACGKGVCRACAVDLGEGLACANSTPAVYKTQSTVGFLAGATFLTIGAATLMTPISWVAPVFLLMSAPMLYQGVRARRLYQTLVESRKQLTS